VDGTAEPDSCELPVVDEASGLRLPGVGEQIEAFVQAKLGASLELGGAALGVRACAPRLASPAARRWVRSAARRARLLSWTLRTTAAK
jgi:hypothetical protein